MFRKLHFVDFWFSFCLLSLGSTKHKHHSHRHIDVQLNEVIFLAALDGLPDKPTH